MKTRIRKPKKSSKMYNYGKVAREKGLEKQSWYKAPCMKMVNGVWQ